MQLNDLRKLAERYWLEIPNHFPFVELAAFVIMPNHMHGILIINRKDADQTNANEKTNPDGTTDVNGITNVETRHCLDSTNATNATNPTTSPNPPPSTNKSIGQMCFQNHGKNTVSSIVGSYKSVVSKHAWSINKNFAWQSPFHDQIIRNAESFDRIQHYVGNNPCNWCKDKFYS
ncbi:hypothetical protein BH10BAC3_BH10BAC3_22960 [soil metagenome]